MNRSNVDVRQLSETYGITREEVLKLKDEVWTDGLQRARAEHKNLRESIFQEWQDALELSDAATWQQICDAACEQYPVLNTESFDGSREKLGFVDYRQLQDEIEALDNVLGDLVGGSDWVEAFIPTNEGKAPDFPDMASGGLYSASQL